MAVNFLITWMTVFEVGLCVMELVSWATADSPGAVVLLVLVMKWVSKGEWNDSPCRMLISFIFHRCLMIPKLFPSTMFNLDSILLLTKNIQQLRICTFKQECIRKPSICTIKQVNLLDGVRV